MHFVGGPVPIEALLTDIARPIAPRRLGVAMALLIVAIAFLHRACRLACVPACLRVCVRAACAPQLMVPNEKVAVRARSRHCYGVHGRPGVFPPGADLYIEVSLLANGPLRTDPSLMAPEEKAVEAEAFNDKGNRAVKGKQWDHAAQFYAKALKCVASAQAPAPAPAPAPVSAATPIATHHHTPPPQPLTTVRPHVPLVSNTATAALYQIRRGQG
jgi:hypothetical protein